MTGRRILKLALTAALALTGVAALAPASQATYHEMRIRAVFKGPADVSFVELQMTAPGQNFTAGRHLTYYDHTGALVHTSPAFTDVTHGDNQRTILAGDTMAGGPPDFTDGLMYQTLNADAAGGAVCYENSDCFSWGGAGFTGDAMLPSTAGTPASGLSNSQVLARNITANCATLLEDADDTNSSAADFNFVIGFPLRNNSVAPTETACPLPMTPVAATATTTRKKKCKKGRKLKKGKCVKKKRKKK